MASSLNEKIRSARRSTEEAFLRVRAEGPGAGMEGVFGMIRAIDRLNRTLYVARSRLPRDNPELVSLENYAASIFQEFLSRGKPRGKSSVWDWVREYREITQRNRELAALVILLFCGTVLLGWVVAKQLPDFTEALVGAPVLERIAENKEWFSRLNENPVIDGMFIAVNNIKVSFLCFVAGWFFGLGGALVMAYNGLMLGAMLGFAVTHGFDDTMIRFISGHGPLELSVIVMATFSGVLFGRAWIPPYRGQFRARIRSAAAEAFIVVSGVVPWLLLAATVEAFVSPIPTIPLQGKLSLGFFLASIFWILTFWPVRPSPKNAATRRGA
jgi:uncharacterized membrane protein SpoIIM required for sporulation